MREVSTLSKESVELYCERLKNRDEDETMVITKITRCLDLDWQPSLLALPLQFYKLHGIRQRHAALNAKNKGSQQIASNTFLHT